MSQGQHSLCSINPNENCHSAKIEDIVSSPKTTTLGRMENLPLELYPNIFQFLDHQNLATALRVCRNWKKEASDDALWRKLFIQRWGEDLANSCCRRNFDSWKEVYETKHRCDRYDWGMNVINEGDELYLINNGKIAWDLCQCKGKMSKEEEEKLRSQLFLKVWKN